jgi:hypothetical protein
MTETVLFGPEVRLIQNPEVILREVDEDGALLFNPDTNRVRVVNRTGLFIWNLCEKGLDLPSILSELREAFDQVPEAEVPDQVTGYLSEMVRSGFIGRAGEYAPSEHVVTNS